MNIVIGIIAAAASAFAAFSFFKAGLFKARASRQTLLDAGFGWIEKISLGTVRLIALLEILGAAGLVLGVIGYFIGFQWALWFAVAAAIGLVLTMIGAILVHASRGEAKYTLKMNLMLLFPPLVAAVLWAIFPSL
tara:strand:- start:291 stop:695 length:405 start_codon:yes stop_codon:yes gene_type:complete